MEPMGKARARHPSDPTALRGFSAKKDQGSKSVAVLTHRLLNGSLLGLPYRILNIHHKKELLRSLWISAEGSKGCGFRV